MDTNTSQPQKSGSKSLMIGVAVLILIGAGIWYFMSQKTSQTATESAVNQTTENTNMDMTVTPDSSVTQSQEAVMTVDEEGTKIFTLEAKNFSFSVKDITVKNGDRVKIVLVNKGGMHDWVNDLFNARTEIIQAGETAEVEFVANKVGKSEYYCSVGTHRQMGMWGNLIVEE